MSRVIRDIDLQSIQEVRDCLKQAKSAQKIIEKMTQSQIDLIVNSMANAARDKAKRLAAMAVEETGFGNVADNKVKNLVAANDVYNAIKDMKTVGIIRRDEQNRVWEVAYPVGVIAGIIPATNPTSTTIFKTLIAVKARNVIVFCPHPAAAKCTAETARIMQKAAQRAGAPKGLISCITHPTLLATNELMKHKLTDVILVTGGIGMVKAAYSSGKPAFINAGTTFGGIGATMGIQPSLTLGIGSFGNNISYDKIGPQHLLKIKRVAFGTRKMPQSKEEEVVRHFLS